MLTRLLIAAALISFAAPVLADPDPGCKGDPHHCNGGGEPTPTPIPIVPNVELTAEQQQLQDQLQKQQQEQALEQQNNFAPVTNFAPTTSFSSDYEAAASSAYAPNLQPTVGCFKPSTGAVQLKVFGLSIGGGKLDPECVRRELMRFAPTDAHRLHMYCNAPQAIKDHGSADNCLAYGKPTGKPSAGVSQDVAMLMAHQIQQDSRIEQLLEVAAAAERRAAEANSRSRVLQQKESERNKEAEWFGEQIQAIVEKNYNE